MEGRTAIARRAPERENSSTATTRPPRARSLRPQGTLQSTSCRAYQASAEFSGLADRTRIDYVKHIKGIEKELGDFPLAGLTDRRTRGIFMAWRDQLALDRGGRPTTLGKCSRAFLSWSWIVDWSCISVHASWSTLSQLAYRAIWTADDETAFLKPAPGICICRYCSRCGPDSGRPISCACLGPPTTAHIYD